MGKKVKKGIADAVYAKKSAPKENPFATIKPRGMKSNPFEVHLNKEKFQILGRICKHGKGLPGVSRSKAIVKRSQTLGKQFQVKHKSNQFKDRRIGRYLKDDELTEEVLNARFVADKVDKIRGNKHSRFNLDDSEVLTHRGQTLEDIEQFRDDRSDEEDDEDRILNAEFTEAAHFGGDDINVKDRQTAIDEMIVEQKKRKVEIAKEKDEVYQLTEKLDSVYKNLIGVVSKGIKKNEDKKSTDDFDKIMREMLFEPRGKVADKLVTEEELIQKEKNRLELLEKERLKRMKGETGDDVEQTKITHRSADDLDDGYFATGDQSEDTTLTYTLDGKLSTKNELGMTLGEATIEEETKSEEEIDAEEEMESESGEEEENGNDTEDDLSDLKNSDSEEEVADEGKKKLDSLKTPFESIKGCEDELGNDSDIPFTLEMPKTYADLLNIIKPKRNPKLQGTVVDRLIKCNHPMLDAANHEKVVKLFTFLLQYINELFTEAHHENIKMQFQILSHLSPFLFDLIHMSSEKISKVLLNVILEKYNEYITNPKEYPSLETVVFFKIVSNLFSTSDFRHPVVTPCYVFIQHVLSRARITTRQDVAIGLFLVTVVLEFSKLSKRFLPAAFNYLVGIIYLCIPKRPIELMKIIPPFQSTGPMSKILAIRAEDVHETTIEEQLSAEDLVSVTFTPSFKIKTLNCSLKLIKEMIDLSAENIGSNYLATPFLEMLERIPLNIYPTFVQNSFHDAIHSLDIVSKKSLHKLVPVAKRPKALRLLEPRIEVVYDDKRRPKISKEKEERVKLLAKVKRETKGAVREIRRDTEYLQKIKIKQQIESDKERKEKVKRIYQEASVQQGELNELARIKKKKKF